MKKYILAVFTGFILSVLTFTGCAGGTENSYTQISINEAIEMMETEDNYIILDVRTKEEYAERRIEGSVNLPLQEIEKISSLIPDKNTPIFLHCRSGKRSSRAAKILVSMGYTRAVNIGGIKDYR